MDNLKVAKELIICYLTDRATKLAMNEDLENFHLVKHELDEIKHDNNDKLYVYIDILRNMFEKAKKESAPEIAPEKVENVEPVAIESKGYTEEQLREFKTTDLRKIARDIPNIGLTKIEIRDAKKEPLIEAILKAQNNN